MKKIRYNSFVFAFLSIQIIYFAFDPNTNLVLAISPVVCTVYCALCTVCHVLHTSQTESGGPHSGYLPTFSPVKQPTRNTGHSTPCTTEAVNVDSEFETRSG